MGYGNLIIIGGAEDKKGECVILKNVVERARTREGSMILMTAATKLPKEVEAEYKNVFAKLGFDDIQSIDIQCREDADNTAYLDLLKNCSSVFFTGGDQLKITSLIGGTHLYSCLKESFEKGVLIVGTSAGASCLCSTMIVSGLDKDSPRKCTIKMAPGLDIIRGVIIDQHFSQRGRSGRLFNAVAQNPGLIGIGIDENTAINFEDSDGFYITGEGAVIIVDGRNIKSTNVSELSPNEIIAISDLKIHVLPKGYGFNLNDYSVIIPRV